MNKIHKFDAQVEWQGNTGQGTLNYKAYKRNYTILAKNKPKIEGSSDPVFLGDGTKYNPEELLIASASSCHMLWYLHLCADCDVIVKEKSMIEKALDLHGKAGQMCFIANSCNFPINHKPPVKTIE